MLHEKDNQAIEEKAELWAKLIIMSIGFFIDLILSFLILFMNFFYLCLLNCQYKACLSVYLIY